MGWKDTIQAAPASAPKSWRETVQAAPDGSDSSPVAAGAAGVLNLGGLGPIIGAAGQTAMDAITGVNGPLAGGSVDDLVDEYRSERDKNRADFAKKMAAHPVIAGVGQVAGGMAALSPFGAAAVSPAGLATTGAITGAASSNADLTKAIQDPTQVVQAAGDAAKGAVTNLVTGKVIEAAAPYVAGAVKSGASKVADFLGDTAERAAVKSLNPTAGQMKSLIQADNVNGLGRTLLDNDVVTPFASLEDKLGSVQDLAQTSGKAIGDIGGDLDQAGLQTFSAGDLSAEVGQSAKQYAPFKTSQPTFQALDNVESDLGNFPNDASFGTAAKIKDFVSGEIQKSGGFKPIQASEKNQALRDVYSMIRSKLESSTEQAAKDMGDPELLDTYLNAKKTYGDTQTAQDILERSVGREAANNRVGLGSTVLAAGELAAGNPAKAAATAGVWELGKAYGNNALAVGADKISNILSNNPGVFGQFTNILQSAAARGTTSLGATHYMLQQTSPEYREKTRQVFSQ